MDLKKRRTSLRHICAQCHRAYSRAWVLKRHLVEYHDLQPLYNSIKLPSRGKQNPLEVQNMTIMQMIMYDLARKNQSAPPIPSKQEIQKTFDLATKISRPIYDGAKLALQNQRIFLEKLWTKFIVFPKNLISGFSCFYCERCLASESPIPIKDRGVDLTCEGRHRCPAANSERVTPISQITPAQRSKMGNEMFKMFNLLYDYIELWIPGKKIIVASRIDVPAGQGNENNRNYLEKRYGVPRRNHFQDIASLDKVPWIQRLLRSGKIEPTKKELQDFCAYCDGTYAILQVHFRDSVEYYAVHLAPDEPSNLILL